MSSINCYRFIRPLLFQLDPEIAHHFVFSLGRALQTCPPVPKLIKRFFSKDFPELGNELFGLHFRNPIGVAAGFDKNGLLSPLLDAFGFSFVEVGSLSNKPCVGNKKPRLFRLPKDRALINRMGLNNDGVDIVLRRLQNAPSSLLVATSIVKTNDSRLLNQGAIDDIVECYRRAHSRSRFVVLNVSCPNTEDGKTFEEPDSLRQLLGALDAIRRNESKHTPLLVKFSADTELSQLEESIRICEEHSVSGYVLVNTSTSRQGLLSHSGLLEKIGAGGLSGFPLQKNALVRIGAVYRLTKKPIIGVGGIFSAEDAYAFLQEGASLLELYTGMIYEGPFIARKINEELVKLLKKDGISDIKKIIGVKHR